MSRKIVFHAPGSRTVTVHPHNRSSAGLSMFVHRATFAKDSSGAFLRPGSHRPETRAKRTPIDAVDALAKDAKFDTLSPKDQKLLIDHFKDEFGYSEKVAREQLRLNSASDLKIHLDAAKNGYM